MTMLITSWTGYFPVTLTATACSWIKIDWHPLKDIERAKRTRRLYRKKGRSAFIPFGKAQEKE